MKVRIFEHEEDEERIYFKKNLKGLDVDFVEGEINEDNFEKYSDTEVLVVFIDSKINKKVISGLKNLKAVITTSTGYDHIDIKECKKKKIKVFNVPHYGENTVAEHSFGLILALAKNIVKSVELTRRGKFDCGELEGIDIKGKTLGIIGLGSIGKHTAKIARGFGMKILAFNKTKDKKLERSLGIKYVSLEELLKNSDVVSLHLPLTKKTKHIINKRNIKKMKRGSILVNTARGGLVDTTALLYGLEKGILSGVGLDVLEEENLIKEEKSVFSKKTSREEFVAVLENHILMDKDNVIITPHNAFHTQEALKRILDTSIDNINSVVKNSKKMENRVC